MRESRTLGDSRRGLRRAGRFRRGVGEGDWGLLRCRAGGGWRRNAVARHRQAERATVCALSGHADQPQGSGWGLHPGRKKIVMTDELCAIAPQSCFFRFRSLLVGSHAMRNTRVPFWPGECRRAWVVKQTTASVPINQSPGKAGPSRQGNGHHSLSTAARRVILARHAGQLGFRHPNIGSYSSGTLGILHTVRNR